MRIPVKVYEKIDHLVSMERWRDVVKIVAREDTCWLENKGGQLYLVSVV